MPHDFAFALRSTICAAPSLAIEEFFALAEALGIDGVEIRNDLSGNADPRRHAGPRRSSDAAARHG